MAEQRARGQGSFTLSNEPVTPAVRPKEDEESASTAREPLLVAIARNPRQLFVCWSVDWRNAFAQEEPPDRRVHLRVYSSGSETATEIQPMTAYAVVSDREPGAAYSAELGYFGPGGTWKVVATCGEVVMPFVGASSGEAVTIPMHLSFQRMVEITGTADPGELAFSLARLEREAAGFDAANVRNALSALGISRSDVERTRVASEMLKHFPAVRQHSRLGSGSPRQGFGGS